MIALWLGFNYLCDLTHKWLPKLFIHVRACVSVFVCACVTVSPKGTNTMSHLSLRQTLKSFLSEVRSICVSVLKGKCIIYGVSEADGHLL